MDECTSCGELRVLDDKCICSECAPEFESEANRLRAELDRVKSDAVELEQTYTETVLELERVTKERENALDTLCSLRSEYDAVCAQINEQQAELERVTKEREDAQAQANVYADALDAARAEVAEWERMRDQNHEMGQAWTPERGCGDNSCSFRTARGGMSTNGGCRCHENPQVARKVFRMLRAEVAALKTRLDDATGQKTDAEWYRSEVAAQRGWAEPAIADYRRAIRSEAIAETIEACAKVADEAPSWWGGTEAGLSIAKAEATAIAAAIRALTGVLK